ncbi:RHS repeat-associated core domain-containing protein [Promicromonospora thailandica]|uniref:RHS repeat-associated core domain-containing protein n=1 Tax=Promicromonospora thailandica TaxID=765201 RepID=A0A9X2G344_9MICO|nr:RHS repeat-associated core domain-containing protein [Promicromonospora thailandica]MCP2264875.1 RHS repeat-associated core domain-containing protein [Promicromonospora thailandica]
MVLLLATPAVATAVAAGFDATARQEMTLEEAREYTDKLGFENPEVDLVEATEMTAEELAVTEAGLEPMEAVRPQTVTLPEPGSITLDPSTTGNDAKAASAKSDGRRGRAGGLQVGLHPIDPDAMKTARPVTVSYLGSAAADRLGAAGPVVTLTPAAPVDSPMAKTPSAEASDRRAVVDLDVSYLAGAGGGLIHRLRLVQLPACAVSSAPASSTVCGEPAPVADSKLDPDLLTLSGTVELPAVSDQADSSSAGLRSPDAVERVASRASDTLVLAVMAETSGSAGDWGATSLAPSASWNVSAQTGAFTWSYPMRTPPVPGGLAPDLSLSYSSASMDGKVVSANSQSSQVGDGWEANLSGYVERKYVPCSQDQGAVGGQAPNNASRATGDLCWKSNNATLVFNGSATELVRDGATSTWRPENDDNTVVSHVTGSANSDNNGESWVVTTDDGTKYRFGQGQRSDGLGLNSSWHVPVYGNHPGEPCYQAGDFAGSKCDQVWRWMLDYVEDVSGNSMTYRYTREYNRYGHNNNSGSSQYVSGGRLWYMEYGTRAGAEGTTEAPARLSLTYAERCIPTADFDCAPEKLNAANSAHWPDVPQDLICTSTSSCTQTAPAFYDRMRLTGMTTNIRDAGALVPVDTWTFAQSFPDAGDGEDPALWLESIKHTGRGGSAADIALPSVVFHGAQKDNRVDTTGDVGPAMTRYRLDKITSESGGVTTIAYSGKECSTSNLPSSPQNNSMRCQPVFWTPEGADEQVMEYFHHYRVTSVTQDGRISGTVPVDTTYEYSGGPGWHYTDNELIEPKYRTWGELRGYERVDVYTGASGEEGSPRLHTATRYFRGMHGDRDGAGGTTTVKVDGIEDLDQYAGMVREEITYDGNDIVEQVISTPWRSAVTATDPDNTSRKAFHTGVSATETVTPLAAGGSRTTRTETTFDPYGMPTSVSESGDTATTGDELCTRTTYNRNTTKNILNTAGRVETVDVRCDQTAARPVDVVSDLRYAYDSGTVSAAPIRGRVTLTQEVDRYEAGNPVYVDAARAGYNSYGQLTSSTDALGKTTTTSYDNAGGLLRSSTVTSPDPDGTGALQAHVTTTAVDPLWGVPLRATDPNGKVTTGRYDALGRLTQVWEPGRVPDQDDPTTKFTYQVSTSGLNSVRTETLNWDASGYVASSVIYDGLLRERQSQAPSASATVVGRVISDTLYDSRGLTWVTRDGWPTTGVPSASLVVSQKAVDSRVVTMFDGAGRPVRETFQAGEGDEADDGSYLDTWTTTTSYGGDRVSVNPPVGGTPTTTIIDARGRTDELWQYEGASPSGTHHVTSYQYDGADRLIGVSDPAGNRWSYEYDLRGRQTSASDPDKGDSSMTYDAAGRVLTTTDARGETLGYTYDALGRKTTMRAGGTSGTVRASWTYDRLDDGTVVKGQQTASTRHQGGAQYTTTIDGFTDRYLPTATTVSVPETSTTPEGLAGDYTYEYTYTEDGRLRTQLVPGAGPIAQEGLTTFYSDTNAVDGLTGGFGWGSYVVRADYLPTGELSYMRTGNTYAYQESLYYDRGTRRLGGVTTTQQTGSTDEQLTDLRHASYTYDDAGNVLSVKDTPDPVLGNQPSDQQCFTYDWARRLTGAWTPETGDCATTPTVAGLGGADPYQKSYTYDAIGNRETSTLHRAVSDGGNVTSTYTQPDSGASSTRPHAVTGVSASGGGAMLGTSAFTYDQAGNMTGREVAGEAVQELSWDVEGELESVAQDTDDDGSVSEDEAGQADGYVYSADGSRLVRAQGGDTTLYLPGQEVTLDGETGQVTANRYYAFAGRTVAVRDVSQSYATTSVFSDHQGTGTIQIGNTTNQVVRRYTDPFGAERDSAAGLPDDTASGASAWAGDHGFLDKPADATGLTAVGARLYDPVLGSFIGVDPVMDLSDPQQWNAYAYANNNPVTWSDPTGLKPIGAGHLGYDPRTQPNGGDPCAGATSCIKTSNGSGGAPVKVRECYTAYACGYFSTHADAYETSSGNAVDLVNQTGALGGGVKEIRSGAAAAAHQLALRKAAEAAVSETRETETQKREQKNLWQTVTGWASAERGYGGWSGQKVSGVLGDASVIIGWGTAGTCFLTKWCAAHPVTAAVAGVLGGISAVAGAAATAIDCASSLRSAGCVIGGAAIAAGSLGFAARTAGRLDPVTVEGFEVIGNVWSKTLDVAGVLEKMVNG